MSGPDDNVSAGLDATGSARVTGGAISAGVIGTASVIFRSGLGDLVFTGIGVTG